MIAFLNIFILVVILMISMIGSGRGNVDRRGIEADHTRPHEAVRRAIVADV